MHTSLSPASQILAILSFYTVLCFKMPISPVSASYSSTLTLSKLQPWQQKWKFNITCSLLPNAHKMAVFLITTYFTMHFILTYLKFAFHQKVNISNMIRVWFGILKHVYIVQQLKLSNKRHTLLHTLTKFCDMTLKFYCKKFSISLMWLGVWLGSTYHVQGLGSILSTPSCYTTHGYELWPS